MTRTLGPARADRFAALLPTPRSVTPAEGEFVVGYRARIAGGGDAARVLADHLRRAGGVRIVDDPDAPAITFHDAELAPEGYRLRVRDGGVDVWAADPRGAHWAVQTLLQLLPDEVFGPGPMEPESLRAPACDVEDAPAMGWRGSHVDVARHFLPIADLHRHLAVMAMHKLNVLHLHLTDDQGWRVPIARYPRLTEGGARRPGTGPGHQPPPDEDDCDDVDFHDEVPHGGHYTVEELRGLVEHAGRLGIDVVPEIDMPGHMEAAIAAYPELGCTEVQHPRTCFGISEHVLALTEETLDFCRAVLDEVMAIFPRVPIHVGGDECPSREWFADERTLATMREHGLTTGAEAQAWFEDAICRHVLERGRRVIAWDEVLEGGVPEEVIVMAWREHEVIGRAARAGHDVIAAPGACTYFDHAQYDEGEPLAIGTGLTLERVAGFSDVLGALAPSERERVLGGQFQLWSEYVHSWARAEHLLWPRGCSMAQQCWAGTAEGAHTVDELEAHLRRLTARGVRWCRPRGEA